LKQISGQGALLLERSYLNEGNQVYTTALKGPVPKENPTKYQGVSLVPSGFPQGPSLSYQAAPCTTACDDPSSMIYMQKVNHHFLYQSGQSTGLNYNQRRYIGFALKYSGDTPKGEVILTQLWQGAPFTPPFAAVATGEDGQTVLRFVVRNHSTGSNPSAVPKEIGRMPIVHDQWYQFVMSVYPEHLNIPHRTGNTTLAINVAGPTGTNFEKVATYHGKWGYDPISSCHYAGQCNLGRLPNKQLDFKFGLYRRGEDTSIRVDYDNIRLASDFASAIPSMSCVMP
jgi:hypothetical protein